MTAGQINELVRLLQKYATEYCPYCRAGLRREATVCGHEHPDVLIPSSDEFCSEDMAEECHAGLAWDMINRLTSPMPWGIKPTVRPRRKVRRVR